MAQFKNLIVTGPSSFVGNIHCLGNNKAVKIGNASYSAGLHMGSGGVNRGLYDWTLGKWMIYADASNVHVNGNATTATTWATARNFYVADNDATNTGPATTGVNGSANVTIKLPATIKATLTGNASTATQFSSNATVAVTGDMTGTSAGSKKSWSVPVAIVHKTIDGTYKTAYRTLVKGDTNAGSFIRTIRTNTASVAGAPQYGSGIGWGGSDTHGYLYVGYNSMEAYLGGGNADKLSWVNKIAFADGANTFSGANTHSGNNTFSGANTFSGLITATGKISVPTTGVQWIGGKTITNASIQVSTTQSTNAYHPVLAIKSSSGNVWNIGGLGDNIGIYGYYSATTNNQTDFSTVWNTATGAITHNKDLTVSGTTTAANINSYSINPRSSSTYNLGSSSKYWVNCWSYSFNGMSLYLHDGTQTVQQIYNSTDECLEFIFS